MPRTVSIAAQLPAAAARLYRMYLDPKQHAAFTGAPVKIAARAGAGFEAFGGALTGTILQVVSKYYWNPWPAYLTRSQ
jgi:uncharacterized protein YndB with AHSA1/START domain